MSLRSLLGGGWTCGRVNNFSMLALQPLIVRRFPPTISLARLVGEG
jgi:hypothetical protein